MDLYEGERVEFILVILGFILRFILVFFLSVLFLEFDYSLKTAEFTVDLSKKGFACFNK